MAGVNVIRTHVDQETILNAVEKAKEKGALVLTSNQKNFLLFVTKEFDLPTNEMVLLSTVNEPFKMPSSQEIERFRAKIDRHPELLTNPDDVVKMKMTSEGQMIPWVVFVLFLEKISLKFFQKKGQKLCVFVFGLEFTFLIH